MKHSPLLFALLTTGALVAAPAFAQTDSAASPPKNNAASSGNSAPNSLPAGAGTVTPADTRAGTVNTVGGGGTPPSTQPNAIPAAPSGSTTANPSAAFQQTVPQPATK